MSRTVRRSAALVATAAVVGAVLIAPAASAAVVAEPVRHDADDATVAIDPIGSYETGVFDESAAEIVQAHGDRLFVVNAQAGAVEVLDYTDPAAISHEFTLSSVGVANSVAIRSDGLGIIAVEAPDKTAPGHLVFFDATAADAESAYLGEVTVGALPDMVTVSADGTYAVVANEGEPADDFSTDPEGSVGVVTLPSALVAPGQHDVRTATFHEFEAGGSKDLPADVRVFGPTPHGADLPVSRNLEPEYIAVDGTTAYAALQEAGAVAVVDLPTATVTAIWPLGFADHSVTGIDPSDRDPRDAPTFDIRTYEGLFGIYMPDGIASYTAGGQTYLVTANEGDAREWGDYVEPSRVADLAKSGYGPVCADSPLVSFLGASELGRLNVTTELGYDEAAGCYSELYAFGSRSFSIWTTDGQQVFDSGTDFEEITHAAAPEFFNSNHTEANLEGRSDDKGPEPENVTIGAVGERTYAFVGLERVGGIMVYDITNPADAAFVTYVNNRDFTVDQETSAAGDLGAEGLTFIPAEKSATGAPLLAVANEVSGTTTLYSVTDLTVPQNTVAPAISGKAKLGSVLTASTGTWTPGVGEGALRYNYQWLRDGEPIARATSATYRVGLSDLGRTIAVRVTATQGSATATATSAHIGIAAPSVTFAIASPTIATTATNVTIATATVSTGPVPATGEVTITVAGRTVTATVTDNVAVVSVGKLPRGFHVIRVAYHGDERTAPSSGLGLVYVR